VAVTGTALQQNRRATRQDRPIFPRTTNWLIDARNDRTRSVIELPVWSKMPSENNPRKIGSDRSCLRRFFWRAVLCHRLGLCGADGAAPSTFGCGISHGMRCLAG
jgi:hypothetical protein